MSGEDQQPPADVVADAEVTAADEPATEVRTIRVGQWRHKTVDGGYRFSRFGDEVELPADEIERGELAGVFTAAPIPAVRSAEVDRALADIVSQIPIPVGADGSDAATLHHDITNRDQQIAVGALEHFLGVADREDAVTAPPAADPTAATPPVTGDADSTPPAAQAPQGAADSGSGGDGTGDSTPAVPAPPKRPAKAASVDVWRTYIAAVKPELADEVASMGKDDLQAQAPKVD